MKKKREEAGEKVMNAIGERISEIRKAYGITQTELGKRIDKTQMTIAKYENGQVDIKVNTLLLLAKALECEITDFFEKE